MLWNSQRKAPASPRRGSFRPPSWVFIALPACTFQPSRNRGPGCVAAAFRGVDVAKCPSDVAEIQKRPRNRGAFVEFVGLGYLPFLGAFFAGFFLAIDDLSLQTFCKSFPDWKCRGRQFCPLQHFYERQRLVSRSFTRNFAMRENTDVVRRESRMELCTTPTALQGFVRKAGASSRTPNYFGGTTAYVPP
jgi:hypothetical protein